MRSVNISSIDLNLLYMLMVVLEERSATRAARRLHISQSAVSNGLRRARELFDDPLLLRRAHGLEPTPQASSLLPALRAWVDGAEQLLQQAPYFDPALTTRTFRIASTDAVALILLAPVLRILGERAPHASLQMMTLERMLADDGLERGSVDLLVGMPPSLRPGQQSELLYHDPMVCLARAGHHRVRGRLHLNRFVELPHVDVALFNAVDDRVDRALAKVDRARNVQVILSHFSAIPAALAATDCIATVPKRLAQTLSQHVPLKVLTAPVEIDPVEIRQVWHQRYTDDPGGCFLRQVLRDAARAGTPAPTPSNNHVRSAARMR